MCIFVLMETLHLNLNSSDPLRDLDSQANINELQFWQAYLYLLNLKTNKLTDLEQKVFAYVLASDYYKSVFRHGNCKKAANEIGIGNQQLSYIKGQLIDKGYLIEGISRTDVLPHPKFRSFQQYIKNNPGMSINLMLPYKIQINEEG